MKYDPAAHCRSLSPDLPDNLNWQSLRSSCGTAEWPCTRMWWIAYTMLIQLGALPVLPRKSRFLDPAVGLAEMNLDRVIGGT